MSANSIIYSLRRIANYELLTTADDSPVVRCRIANSVHQTHEASGRILAWATRSALRDHRGRGRVARIRGREAVPQAVIDGGWQPHKPGAVPGGARRYVAEVPELSAGSPAIPGLPWESLSHRQVLAELATQGWVPCGGGRLGGGAAVTGGSPRRASVPVRPGLLGLRGPVPRVRRQPVAAEDRAGRGPRRRRFGRLPGIRRPVDHPVVKHFAEQWRARAEDADFQEVRRAAQMIDAEYRKSTPWWGRCDLDDDHIFRAADGRPVLIDVFCMAGTELYRDPRRRRRGAPPDSARADALRTGHPLYRPGEQHRRDPRPQKRLGTRPDGHARVCKGAAADTSSRSRTPDLPPNQPTSWQRQPTPDRRERVRRRDRALITQREGAASPLLAYQVIYALSTTGIR
jgi:hypothetical protein